MRQKWKENTLTRRFQVGHTERMMAMSSFFGHTHRSFLVTWYQGTTEPAFPSGIVQILVGSESVLGA